MKELNHYIVEKLHINKDTDFFSLEDLYHKIDYDSVEYDDIINFLNELFERLVKKKYHPTTYNISSFSPEKEDFLNKLRKSNIILGRSDDKYYKYYFYWKENDKKFVRYALDYTDGWYKFDGEFWWDMNDKDKADNEFITLFRSWKCDDCIFIEDSNDISKIKGTLKAVCR